MSNQSNAIYESKGQQDAIDGLPAKYENAYSWQAKAYLKGYKEAKQELQNIVIKREEKFLQTLPNITLEKVTQSRNKREGRYAGKIRLADRVVHTRLNGKYSHFALNPAKGYN